MLHLEQLVKVYSPHKCRFCPEVGAPICSECIVGSTTEVSSACTFCNSLTTDFKVCQNCRRKTPLRHVWFASRYESDIKDYIWDFKFHKQRAMDQPLAHLLVSPIHLEGFDFVTWVPTAPKHRRRRGYDHAKLLARRAAEELGVPARSMLIRSGSARQVGVRRAQRWRQAKEQYQTRRNGQIRDKRILLIDDVATSGATLATCAERLKNAGALKVDAAVVAKD